ncbi:MAG: SMC family ATPase [Anaerolineaceae bacterium]|nr:SMC family ATPase [Anaerolineaceae bacterium]
MIPNKITISGFMSYREPQTIDFRDASLWALSGKNGAGKSAVFDAITFVLFGIYRNQAQNYGDLINHQSDRAVIEFDFTVGDQEYRVRRTIPKKGLATRSAATLIRGNPDQIIPIPGTEKDKGFDEWVTKKVGLNYFTFTSSVLLMQNNSDSLLDAPIDKRYDVLSQLIDLSRYEALEKKAREWEKHWKGIAIAHRDRLRGMLDITDALIASTQSRIDQAASGHSAAQSRVGELTTLFGQAKEWEMRSSERQTCLNELAQAKKVTADEAGIASRFHRWQELQQCLPILETVLAARTRLSTTSKEIVRCQAEYDATLEPLAQAHTQANVLAEKVVAQDACVEAVRQTWMDASQKVAGLAPTIALLDRVDDDNREAVRLRKVVAGYPSDLDTQARSFANQSNSANIACQSLRDLSRLATERLELQRSVNKRQASEEVIDGLENRLTQQVAERDALAAQLQDATTEEWRCRENRTRAETLLDEANTRVEMFESVVGEPTCRYCGKGLDAAHILTERNELEITVEHQKQALLDTDRLYRAAATTLLRVTEQHAKARTDVTDTDGKLAREKQSLQGSDDQINRHVEALRESFENLSVVYQSKVATTMPANSSGWLATIYPATDDLTAIRHEGEKASDLEKSLKALQAQQQTRKTDWALLEAKEKSLRETRQTLPSGWDQARDVYSRGIMLRDRSSAELGAAQAEQRLLNANLATAQKSTDEIGRRQVHAHDELSRHQAKQAEIQDTLVGQIRQLPEAWQKIGEAITLVTMQSFRNEFAGLHSANTQYHTLSTARAAAERCTRRIGELDQEILIIPAAAHQSAQKVHEMLGLAQDALTQVGKQKVEAEQDLQRLTSAQKERVATQTSLREAERKEYLYGILAVQFGDRGIRARLINRAENAIVDLASGTLDNLSAGRSRLALREEGKNHQALDLVVYDRKTGNGQPLPIVLASGSQRFRIAISLALAIGQYVRRDSRRIESVIIDEGFGGLDKEGLKNTISELHNLSQFLERIILVSHQEEFNVPAASVYEIDIPDEENATRVRLKGR